jgi:hypothetical protein
VQAQARVVQQALVQVPPVPAQVLPAQPQVLLGPLARVPPQVPLAVWPVWPVRWAFRSPRWPWLAVSPLPPPLPLLPTIPARNIG